MSLVSNISLVSVLLCNNVIKHLAGPMSMRDIVHTLNILHPLPDCPASWVDYQHACYWPSVTITKNHSEAESDCIDKGGHLTSTVTAMEADVVRRIAKMP